MIKFIKIIINAVKHYVDEKFKATLSSLEEKFKTMLSDWDENDETSLNYIKNRTHYDNRVITKKEETVSLTFDGRMSSGLNYIDGYDEYGDRIGFVKISDTPLTKEQFIGCRLEYIADGAIDETFITEDLLVDNGNYITYNSRVFSIFTDRVYSEQFDDYMDRGVWVYCNEYWGHYSKISYKDLRSHVEGELKKLDWKYLPDDVVGVNKDLTDEELNKFYSNIQLEDRVTNIKHNNIVMIDQVTGYNYLLFMHNGILSTAMNAFIQVVNAQNKTDYTDTEEFDPTGMVLMLVYEDGRTKEVEEFTYDKYVTTGSKTHTVCCIDNGVKYYAEIPITTRSLEDALIDFEYIYDNETYTLTGWKGTYNGLESTEMIIPNSPLIMINIEEPEWEEDDD